MPFDLTPKNKGVSEMQYNIHFWSWLIESGVGLVLGAGAGAVSGTTVYRPRKGTGPLYNDGYTVTRFEAKAMAYAARGLANVLEARNEAIEKLPIADVVNAKEPVLQGADELLIHKVREFADWAEHSGGFRIW